MISLAIAVPVIIAMVSALKAAGLSSRFAPIIAIILGVVGFYFGGDADVVTNVFNGIIAGLSAAGLYSGTKATLK